MAEDPLQPDILAFIGCSEVFDASPSKRISRTNDVTDHVMDRVDAGTTNQHINLNMKAEFHAERSELFDTAAKTTHNPIAQVVNEIKAAWHEFEAVRYDKKVIEAEREEQKDAS